MESLKIHPQIITDESGKKLGVFLPNKDFDNLLEELEDQEDAKAFLQANGKNDKEFIPLKQALEEIEKGK